ncbi:hypothetical protein WJX74_004659 [Apatococcus lobatus]|uniref:Uncharacterized protein n=1 Tax=Apatococcus lobatus TaxID=904363 RepID=A0AAW1RWK8_9CHLO
MKMPFGPIGAAIFPLVFLALASWVVALAGVASLQHLTTGDKHAWQFDWWIVLLNLVAFCLVAAYTLMGPHRSNIGVVALLAVVTTLNMIRCDVFNTIRLELDSSSTPASSSGSAATGRRLLANSTTQRVDTLFAGYLLMSVFSVLQMLVLGHYQSTSQSEYSSKNVNAEARGLSSSVSGVPTGAATTTHAVPATTV